MSYLKWHITAATGTNPANCSDYNDAYYRVFYAQPSHAGIGCQFANNSFNNFNKLYGGPGPGMVCRNWTFGFWHDWRGIGTEV